jgi:hypothetical protein
MCASRTRASDTALRLDLPGVDSAQGCRTKAGAALQRRGGSIVGGERNLSKVAGGRGRNRGNFLRGSEFSCGGVQVEIEAVAQDGFGDVRKAPEGILDAVAEEFPAEQIVVNGRTEINLQPTPIVMEEVEIVAPAGEEKFPLKLGQLRELRGLLRAEARVFKGREERRHDDPLRAFHGVEQIERLSGVGFCFAGQADDPGAEREPVVGIQNFHPFHHDVRPLFRAEGIAFAGHVLFEEAHRAGLEADDDAGVALVRMSGGGMALAAFVYSEGRELFDHVGLEDDGGDGGVGLVDVADARLGGQGFVEIDQRRCIGLEARALFEQEKILGGEHDGVRAIGHIGADVQQNIFERDAAATTYGHAAELATAPAASRDLDHAECRTVARDGDFVHARAFAFHGAGKRLAAHRRVEKREDMRFGFAVDDAIDAPFVLFFSVQNLPCARPADEDFHVMFVAADGWMLDHFLPFGGVQRLVFKASELGIDVRGEGDAERIVRVDAEGQGVVAEELIELVRVANYNVFVRKRLQQDRFNDAQAVGDVARLAVGAEFVPEGFKIGETVSNAGGQGGIEHLDPAVLLAFV